MARTVRKSLANAGIPALLLSLLLLHASAWGDDGAKGAKEAAAKPAVAADSAGKIDAQLETVKADIKADPANASLHVRLAYLLVRKGSLDEAMRSFDEALKLNPRSCDAKTGRGVVLALKGNLKEAEQALQEALILNPNPVRAHYELGQVYQKLGDQEKAIAEFKEGIKKHEQGRM